MTRKIIAAFVAIYLVLMISIARADVDDEHTVALLHFDSDITDESGKAWIAEGNAAATSSEKVFGAGSLYLDGNGDSAYTASSTDFAFSGDFTVDFRIKFKSVGAYVALIDTGNYATSQGLYIQIRESNTRLAIYCNAYYTINAVNTFALDTWYHLAVSRKDSDVKLFIDGNQIATGTYSNSIPSALPFKVGREPTGLYANAYYDELRVSNGIARWTTDFTPPSAPYAPASKIEGFIFCDDGRLNFANSGRLYLR